MKNAITILPKLTISFLAICVFFTSCNGQVKKDLPKDTVSESKMIADGQPKLVKNLGLTKR